jgi:hypothetical protein
VIPTLLDFRLISQRMLGEAETGLERPTSDFMGLGRPRERKHNHFESESADRADLSPEKRAIFSWYGHSIPVKPPDSGQTFVEGPISGRNKLLKGSRRKKSVSSTT